MQATEPLMTVNREKPNKWTVMVYMAGDNNLDNLGIADLREMKRVGSTDQVQVIAELDRANEFVTKRYWLKNHSVRPRLQDDVVEELDESNSGSPEQLTKFIRWGMYNFEAEHYLVIIWGHGAGAYDEDIYYSDRNRLGRATRRRGMFRPSIAPPLGEVTGLLDSNKLLLEMRLIAPDDQARDFIDNVELKNALQAVGRKIEILGMDACLMSMIEVCYQLQHLVDITVSSEAQEPLEGWPYEAFLRLLTDSPEMKPPRVAKLIVEEFVKLYEDYENSSTTLAACDLTKCDVIKAGLADLSDALLANLHENEVFDAIMLVRYLVQSNEAIETVDLYDLCELLKLKCKNAAILGSCERLIEAFRDSRMVIKTQPLKDDAKYWHGLGVYFPSSEVSAQYGRLDIVQPGITRWKEFIDKYVSTDGRTHV